MTDHATLDAIDKAVKSNDVVLFMKGTPTFPQCGFSSVVVQILDYLGVEYVSTNVLEDQAVREGIKAYTNWPTIPQLYVKGEFVGGCDIIKEMFEPIEANASAEKVEVAKYEQRDDRHPEQIAREHISAHPALRLGVLGSPGVG
ncbi:MAG: monothiol glutaredoxin, Grx4 family [Hyphomonas sp. 34-62-18]|nr:Grx4 family monothiol glutaredoxin [Hyphomonas sp. 34-62-18]OZB18111.1 MAG: monothiol glutaredoxin, Grx4 family [Hyphomonas sp. 34-62-18]